MDKREKAADNMVVIAKVKHFLPSQRLFETHVNEESKYQ